MQHLENN